MSTSSFIKQTCKASIEHEGFETRRLEFRKSATERLGLRLQLSSVGTHKYYQIREIIEGGVFYYRKLLRVGDYLLSFNKTPLEGVDQIDCTRILTQNVEDVELEILRDKSGKGTLTEATRAADGVSNKSVTSIRRQQQQHRQDAYPTECIAADQNAAESWGTTDLDDIAISPRFDSNVSLSTDEVLEREDGAYVGEPGELFAHNKLRLSFRSYLTSRDTNTAATNDDGEQKHLHLNREIKEYEFPNQCSSVKQPELFNKESFFIPNNYLTNDVPPAKPSSKATSMEISSLDDESSYMGGESSLKNGGRTAGPSDSSQKVEHIDDRLLSLTRKLAMAAVSAVADDDDEDPPPSTSSASSPNNRLSKSTDIGPLPTINRNALLNLSQSYLISESKTRQDSVDRSSEWNDHILSTTDEQVTTKATMYRIDERGLNSDSGYSSLSSRGGRQTASHLRNSNGMVEKPVQEVLQDGLSEAHGGLTSKNYITNVESTYEVSPDKGVNKETNSFEFSSPVWLQSDTDEDSEDSSFPTLNNDSPTTREDKKPRSALSWRSVGSSLFNFGPKTGSPATITDEYYQHDSAMNNVQLETLQEPNVEEFELDLFLNRKADYRSLETSSVGLSDSVIQSRKIILTSPNFQHRGSSESSSPTPSVNRLTEHAANSPFVDRSLNNLERNRAEGFQSDFFGKRTGLLGNQIPMHSAVAETTPSPESTRRHVTQPRHKIMTSAGSASQQGWDCDPPVAGTKINKKESSSSTRYEFPKVASNAVKAASSALVRVGTCWNDKRRYIASALVVGLRDDPDESQRFERLKLHSSVITVSRGRVLLKSMLTPLGCGPMQLPQHRIPYGLFQINVFYGSFARRGVNVDGGNFEMLGITVAFAADGVVVVDMESEGPVGRDGNIRIGDYLLALNEIDLSKLKSFDELNDLFDYIPFGQVELVVYTRLSPSSLISKSDALRQPIYLTVDRNQSERWRMETTSGTRTFSMGNGPITQVLRVNNAQMQIVHLTLPRISSQPKDLQTAAAAAAAATEAAAVGSALPISIRFSRSPANSWLFDTEQSLNRLRPDGVDYEALIERLSSDVRSVLLLSRSEAAQRIVQYSS